MSRPEGSLTPPGAGTSEQARSTASPALSNTGATPSAAPSAAPANPAQVMLAQMFQVLKRLAQENPQMSAGLQKAAQGIQEAQTAMLTGAPGPSPQQNPPQ